MTTLNTVNDLQVGDILENTNHGFSIEIKDIGKKNTRYLNLETGEKVKSFTTKFNFMLRNGVFVKQSAAACNADDHITKLTSSEKMIIKSAIKARRINLKIVNPILVAVDENDIEFIREFNEKVEKANVWAVANDGYLTATLEEQVRWYIDSFIEYG